MLTPLNQQLGSPPSPMTSMAAPPAHPSVASSPAVGAPSYGKYHPDVPSSQYEQPSYSVGQQMAAQGRGPDSMLVHMAPKEVSGLQALAQSAGGSLTINPTTGLPEAGFLESILPMVLGAALAPFTGGLSAALLVGAGTGLVKHDLGAGLMAGLSAFGGAGLGSAIGGALSGAAGGATSGLAGLAGKAGAFLNPAAATAAKAAAASAAGAGAGAAGTGAAEAGLSAAQKAAMGNYFSAMPGAAENVARAGAMSAAQGAAPTAASNMLNGVQFGAEQATHAAPTGLKAIMGNFNQGLTGGGSMGSPIAAPASKLTTLAGMAGAAQGVGSALTPTTKFPGKEENKYPYEGPYHSAPRTARFPQAGERDPNDSSEFQYFDVVNPGIVNAAGQPAGGIPKGTTTPTTVGSQGVGATLAGKLINPATGRPYDDVRGYKKGGGIEDLLGAISPAAMLYKSLQHKDEAPAPVAGAEGAPAAAPAPAEKEGFNPMELSPLWQMMHGGTPANMLMGNLGQDSLLYKLQHHGDKEQIDPVTGQPIPPQDQVVPGYGSGGSISSALTSQLADQTAANKLPGGSANPINPYTGQPIIGGTAPGGVAPGGGYPLTPDGQYVMTPNGPAAIGTYTTDPTSPYYVQQPGGSPAANAHTADMVAAARPARPTYTPVAPTRRTAGGGDFMAQMQAMLAARGQAQGGPPGASRGAPAPGAARGGLVSLKPGGFVVDARTVSEVGNGSSNAGKEALSRVGGKPINGGGDGVSDSIPAKIGGKRPARVARDEVKFSPEALRKLGRGKPERGAQKLYGLMDQAKRARASAGRGDDTQLRRALR